VKIGSKIRAAKYIYRYWWAWACQIKRHTHLSTSLSLAHCNKSEMILLEIFKIECRRSSLLHERCHNPTIISLVSTHQYNNLPRSPPSSTPENPPLIFSPGFHGRILKPYEPEPEPEPSSTRFWPCFRQIRLVKLDLIKWWFSFFQSETA
jgi:hypothetical protein